jgi:hypothetical protein
LKKLPFVSVIQASKIRVDILDVMGSDVENREEKHSVGDLSVEPL